MSAPLLRKAASRMRHDVQNGQQNGSANFILTVSAWLEEVADRQAPVRPGDRRSHGWTGAQLANRVARTYLAERQP